MTEDRSAVVMDQIFSSGEADARAQLLRIMHSFLMTEMTKHSAAEKGLAMAAASHCVSTFSLVNGESNVAKKEVNIDELVGNTQNFADSGSVILQLNL
jgi:cohesin loading factor subunit SCC2